jgi:hypothetical protein
MQIQLASRAVPVALENGQSAANMATVCRNRLFVTLSSASVVADGRVQRKTDFSPNVIGSGSV